MAASRRDRLLLLAFGALVALAAVIAAILASSGGGEGSNVTAKNSSSLADPSGAYEAAARQALPSVVQVRHENGLGSGVVLDSGTSSTSPPPGCTSRTSSGCWRCSGGWSTRATPSS
jgi:hypothetical protein